MKRFLLFGLSLVVLFVLWSVISALWTGVKLAGYRKNASALLDQAKTGGPEKARLAVNELDKALDLESDFGDGYDYLGQAAFLLKDRTPLERAEARLSRVKGPLAPVRLAERCKARFFIASGLVSIDMAAVIDSVTKVEIARLQQGMKQALTDAETWKMQKAACEKAFSGFNEQERSQYGDTQKRVESFPQEEVSAFMDSAAITVSRLEESPEWRKAIELYLRGRALIDERKDPADSEKLMEEAIRLAPDFAEAHTGVALSRLLLQDFAGSESFARKAGDLLDRVGPVLVPKKAAKAEAHAVLSMALLLEAARKSKMRGNRAARLQMKLYKEAVAEAEKAETFDPSNQLVKEAKGFLATAKAKGETP